MSLGFYVAGNVKNVKTLTQKARSTAKKLGYGISVEKDGMCISLCPMGDLEITWAEDEEKPGQWRVEMDCTTSHVGAGFHKAALELTEELGIKNMVVDDETEYYTHRDFARMKKEHFYPWLGTLVRFCQEQAGKKRDGQVLICWDLDSYHPEEVDRTVAAPLGRYSWEYFVDIVEHEGIEALADRFFLWDKEERDALFYRNRALYALWMQCYFRPSSRSGQDREINGAILEDLEKAYQLDPELPLPCEDYREVCRLHGRKPVIPQGAAVLSYEFPIGYRKRLVIESFGPLRLMLPGAYRYEWEENGKGGGANLWCDDFAKSPVWRVSAYQIREGDAKFTDHFEKAELKDLTEYEISNGCIRYGWRKCVENDDEFYVMEVEAVAGSWFYLITVAYNKQEERAGIEELLRRLSAVSVKKE